MYKLLLSWRYLRSRYIALASVISVTLGVATLIVVNSVMAGFTTEMHKRLHGILSDLIVESHSLGGFPDAERHMAEIRDVLGDDVQGMTATVHVPAMLNFEIRGEWITRQVNLIGVDEQTYAQVSDFSQYLLHPENQDRLSFLLREEGYDAAHPGLKGSGWKHRRRTVLEERAFAEQLRLIRRDDPAAEPAADPPAGSETNAAPAPRDPFAMGRRNEPENSQLFDPLREQHTGIILGVNIASLRRRNAEGKVEDLYLRRPGDDVQITLPTANTPPKAASATFTVVDLYESKMSEYDSTFAFVPIRKLQEMRDMVDPLSGVASVTSIQLKLKPGADLNAARDKLRARFPPETYPYHVQTWRDLQGPLLAAVQMETTILNILLFLIIAVAGFGILATFFMIVVEKTRDIGILKSLGAPSGGVMSIFLGYGLLLGLVGSGVGMVIGLLFVAYINEIAAGLEAVSGHEVFNPEIYYFQEIPTIVRPETVAWIVAGSVAIAVMASVLPALRAAVMHPVEALRYE